MMAIECLPTPPPSASSISTAFQDVDNYQCDDQTERDGFLWHQRPELVQEGQIETGLITYFGDDEKSAPVSRPFPPEMTQSNQNYYEINAAYEIHKFPNDKLYLVIRDSRDAWSFARYRLSHEPRRPDDHAIPIKDAFLRCEAYVKALGEDTLVVRDHLVEVVRGREALLG